jgi:hypothetical protein
MHDDAWDEKAKLETRLANRRNSTERLARLPTTSRKPGLL